MTQFSITCLTFGTQRRYFSRTFFNTTAWLCNSRDTSTVLRDNWTPVTFFFYPTVEGLMVFSFKNGYKAADNEI